MTTTTRTEATALGWWLGQAVRVSVALLLLGGLLGAALGAARSSPLPVLAGDLAAGTVSEVVFTDTRAYGVPQLPDRDLHRTVRWKVVGAGWRTAGLEAGELGPAPGPPVGSGGSGSGGSGSGGSGSGGSGSGDFGSDSGDLGSGDAGSGSGDLSSGDSGSGDVAGRNEAAIRRSAGAAGVPVSGSGGGAPHRLVVLASLTLLVLVAILYGGPQPRWATKWAWFWFLLVPGGLAALVWVAVESPWSSRANRRPEPLPHRTQPDDSRLTGGRALVFSGILTAVVTGLGTVAAGWLAG